MFHSPQYFVGRNLAYRLLIKGQASAELQSLDARREPENCNLALTQKEVNWLSYFAEWRMEIPYAQTLVLWWWKVNPPVGLHGSGTCPLGH